MVTKKLWLHEPPDALSAAWAEAFDALVDLLPLDEDGNIPERQQILAFVLNDAITRCAEEARRRDPRALDKRLTRQLAEEKARIDQLLGD